MRKLLNTLFVINEDAYLTLDGENLVVTRNKQETHRYALHTLEGIVCFTYAGASPALMGACARRGIDLCFFDPYGSLQDMNENMVIEFSNLNDKDNEVAIGDPVVTSYVSNRYQQGILIGYISTLSMDSNNLTKSGTITPAVDFEHIEEVLVILNKKQTAES